MNNSAKNINPAISQVLFNEEQIKFRISEIASQINDDYQDKHPVFVGVLKGVFIFMADLLRKIEIDCDVDFLAISNYSNDARNRGMVRLVKDLEISIEGRHVLFIEDVIDTGLTLNFLLRNLQERNPASLRVCTLFNKASRRLIELPIQYKGFDLPDKFVVGYGLDYNEKYRNLPYVGIIKAEIFQQPANNGLKLKQGL
ncbi:MAG: hypoxanthine phosphoribosyltransferase [Anaerolineaceae bacterium]|jgi:hypoxanthine phosphoribosyltransferase|nr:hypoxanthine phosphoribosyltransferase [Anaerolineaceae bacterium]